MLRDLLAATVVVVETSEQGEVSALHPAEAACVEGAVEKRRREFAAGRACARRALGMLGIHDFPLLAGEDRAPIWPHGVVGSISHCTGFCGAAVATRETLAGLGIDVESAAPLESELVPRICLPAETARFAQLPNADMPDWHKLAFSAKESVYKAYFPVTRSFLEFHDVDLEVDPVAGSFVATLLRSDAPSALGARSFDGRWAFDDTHIYTAVTLPAGGSPSD